MKAGEGGSKKEVKRQCGGRDVKVAYKKGMQGVKVFVEGW